MPVNEMLVKFTTKIDPLVVKPLRVAIEDVEFIDPLGGGTFPFAADIRHVFKVFNEKRLLLLNAMAWISWMDWSNHFSWLGDLIKPHGRFVKVEITPLDAKGEKIEALGGQPGFFTESYLEVLYDVSTIDTYLIEGEEIDPMERFSDLLVGVYRNIRVIGFFKFPEGGTMIGYCEDGGLSGFFMEGDLELYPAEIHFNLVRAQHETQAQYGGG